MSPGASIPRTRDKAPPPRSVRIPVGELRVGMFVAELDKPWLDTPFAVQGFVVRSEADIDLIFQHSTTVVVDIARSESGLPTALLTANHPEAAEPSVSLRAEFVRAKVDFASAKDVVAAVFERARTGGQFQVARLASALTPIIDSVLRNQDAMAILARVKNENDYIYSHCLSCAVWGGIFGRHLALDRRSLEALVLGCALIDVGMTALPRELTAIRRSFTTDERERMQQHVGLSLEMIAAGGRADPEVLATVAGHHERWDGSGYPKGHRGPDTPLTARIAGIVDAYDAMITPRPWAPMRSSYEAIRELQDNAGTSFQSSLVQQFSAAIGLFPTGSIVELSSGEVGIVTRQNSVRKLKPEILLVLDANKEPRTRYELLDLFRESTATEIGGARWIVRELPRGAFGINAEDFYL